MAKRRSCVCFAEDFKIEPFFLKVNDFRHEGLFCDGQINCVDGSVKVHRIILSSVSSYFKVAFTNSLNRDENEKTETYVDTSTYYLNLLLDYAYTGSCEITNSNVEELLVYADKYEVLGVVRLCSQFLLQSLSSTNCFHILKFAKKYFCEGLKRHVDKYIKNNFAQIIVNRDKFNKLNVEKVKDILADDELNVRNEKIVWKTIKAWIKHDPDERLKHFDQLFQCLRFYQKDNSKLFKRISKCSWIESEQVKSIEAMIAANIFYINLDIPQMRPRFPYEVLFAVGGWGTGSPTSYIETYDVRADRWFQLSCVDNSPRAYHGVCTLDELLYVIGGFDGSNHFNTVRCFNPVTKTWSEKACMYQARCYISVAVVDGKIYALGGFNGMSRLSSVERYCPKQNQWELIAPMNKQRSDASAASLLGKIYVVGGIDGREILNSGEVYDPISNQWTFIKPMRSPRSGVNLLAFCGLLYALGGYNGNIRLNTCEKLDPDEMNGWEIVAAMSVTRSNFATAVIDDEIFAIGGYDGTGTISTVERYSKKKNKWYAAAPMNVRRSALSACSIAGLSNAKEYSYLFKNAPWEITDDEEFSSSCS